MEHNLFKNLRLDDYYKIILVLSATLLLLSFIFHLNYSNIDFLRRITLFALIGSCIIWFIEGLHLAIALTFRENHVYRPRDIQSFLSGDPSKEDRKFIKKNLKLFLLIKLLHIVVWIIMMMLVF